MVDHTHSDTLQIPATFQLHSLDTAFKATFFLDFGQRRRGTFRPAKLTTTVGTWSVTVVSGWS